MGRVESSMHASGPSALRFWDSSGAVLFAVSCPPCKYLVQQRYKIRLHHCTLHCCKHTSLQQALPCRSTCDFVAGRLQDADIDAAAYHAGLSGAARSRVQQDWSEVGGQHASRPLLQLGSYSVSVCLVPNSAMPMRGMKQQMTVSSPVLQPRGLPSSAAWCKMMLYVVFGCRAAPV